MSFATGIAVGTALSSSSHCHSHGNVPTSFFISMYIALSIMLLPGFLIRVYKWMKAKKNNKDYYPNLHEEVAGTIFIFTQIVAIFISIVNFIHYLIS